MTLKTTDLCDEHSDDLRIMAPIFLDYGGVKAFGGLVSTVKVFEDNSLVRAAVEEPGKGRVLVVDGGGSLRCALLGDNLAELGRGNGWSGMVIYGCIRDSAAIAGIAVGVKALNTNPLKSVKKGEGERDVPVTFAGVTVHPGDYLYADQDGIVLSEVALDG